MRSLHRLAAIASTIVAIAAVALPASAASSGPVHLQKTCPTWTGQVGDICSVTVSDAGPIPVGTVATYYGPTLDPFLDSLVILTTPTGDVAIGRCVLDYDTSGGACAFETGTGSLSGFQAVLTITDHPDTGVTNWDGTYWLGG